ncbi:replication initiator protein A, partial [Deinococcus marmoris]|uniref:replication initiator protein A n=1 Tax=Deinococcus marmoris TaxID=249408 RepID=UPI0039EE53CD
MADQQRTSFDDLNWGRLNLVSAQDQSVDQNSWKVIYQHGERVVRVSCRALPELGVPHGIDNDVSSALIDNYMSIGLPDDGVMTLAISELMRLAGFHRNGKYREMLLVSLDRLHTTSYEIAGGWRDHPNRRWTTAKFHFIELLEYTHQGESGKFDERSMLRIRLAEPLVASLRSGYTKPLNIEFMQSLSRPRTRIIFRLLDAMRYHPETPDELIDSYDIGLIELAEQCKLPNTRPDVVRRALAGPHEELLRRGYLRQFSTGQLAFKWRWVRRKVDLRGRSIFRPVGDPISALSPD